MRNYKAIQLLLCLLLVALPATAQQKAGTLKLKPYTFENSKGEKVDSEFGTLLVPEKRGDPNSNLIELAFVRFKSTAKNPGPPIVYLAGGPGGSGIRRVFIAPYWPALKAQITLTSCQVTFKSISRISRL